MVSLADDAERRTNNVRTTNEVAIELLAYQPEQRGVHCIQEINGMLVERIGVPT
jgi:hypothetical protein